MYDVNNHTLSKVIEYKSKANIEFGSFFYHGTNAFYFNQDGKITGRISINPDTYVSMRANAYLVYSKVGQQIELFHNLPQPKKIWGFDALSYGYLSPSSTRILLITTDNSSISLLNEDSHVILSNQFLSTMITDFDFCDFDDAMVFSTIEGDVIKINYQGNKIFHYSLIKDKENNRKLSIRYPVAKTVAISTRGRYIVSAVGLYQEYIMLFGREGKILWQVSNTENHLTKISFEIDEENKILLQQNHNALIIRRLGNGTIIHRFVYDGTNFYHAKKKSKNHSSNR